MSRGKVEYREARMTKHQWQQALFAFDNLLGRAKTDGGGLYSGVPTTWEQQALWLLRAQLLLASESFMVDDA